MADLESILDFAREEGFEVTSSGEALLPLGKIEDYEYGLTISEAKLYPYGYTRQASKTPNISKEYVSCYVLHSVVKTFDTSDGKTFVIEKKNEEEVQNKKQGLVIAAKFKELGTIEPDFIKRTYAKILKLLPANLAQAELGRLMQEVDDKLEQIENMQFLPDYYKIVSNLAKIKEAYAETAKELGVDSKVLKACEALKIACSKTPQEMYNDGLIKKIICTYKQYPEAMFKALDDEALLKLAGVSAVFAKRSENGITLEDSKFFADLVQDNVYRDEFYRAYAEHFLKKGSTKFCAELAMLIRDDNIRAGMLETIIDSAWKNNEHDVCKSSVEQIQDIEKHDKICLELADLAADQQDYDLCLHLAKLVKGKFAERDGLCDKVLGKLGENEYKTGLEFAGLLHDQAIKDQVHKELAETLVQTHHDYDESYKVLKVIKDDALHDSLCTEFARSTAEKEMYDQSAKFVEAIRKTETKKTVFTPLEIYNFALEAGLEGRLPDYNAAINLLKAAEEVDSPFSDQMLAKFLYNATLTDERIGFIKAMKSEALRNEFCITYAKSAAKRYELYEYAEATTNKEAAAKVFEQLYENLLELRKTDKEEFDKSTEIFNEHALSTLIDVDSDDGYYRAAMLAALREKWTDFEDHAETITDKTKRDKIYSEGALMRFSKSEGLEYAKKIEWPDLRNKTYYEMGEKCLEDYINNPRSASQYRGMDILKLMPKGTRRDDLAYKFADQTCKAYKWGFKTAGSYSIKYAEQIEDKYRRKRLLESYNIKRRLFGYEQYGVGTLRDDKVRMYRTHRYRRLARERKSWGYSAGIGAGLATVGTFLNYIAPYCETNLPVPLQILSPLLMIVGCAGAAGAATKYDNRTREILKTEGIAT